MPEILTESFCERCGTRYTFESAAPRAARLKGLKVMSRGLKNFVLSDDSSLDEAMAAARSDTDREVTSQQLDAFHKTFNFCMSCRQYTCANCWNDAEGRCLSCAPHLGHEILPAPFPDLDPAVIALEANGNGNGVDDHASNGHGAGLAAALAWPTTDLIRDDEETAEAGLDDIPEVDAVARLAALDAVVGDEPEAPDELVADEPTAAAEAAAEPIEADADVAAAATPEPAAVDAVAASEVVDAVPLDVDTAAAVASAQTTDLLQRFRPGQSLDEAIEAFERDRIAAEDAAATAAIAAAATAHDAAKTAPADAPRTDDIEQPTWQIVAPESSPLTDAATAPAPARQPAPVVPPQPVVPPAATAEPQWPTSPEWPSHQAASQPMMNRSAASGLDTLWAESAREVATVAALPGAGAAGASAKAGVQPCVSCGLSLSATARFCRRCGTRQG